MEHSLKFKSYDGKVPNLCSGTLTLTLDGVDIVFPTHCLFSEGTIKKLNKKGDQIIKGSWIIREFPRNFPKELEKRALDLINENIPYGCCGGCLTQSELGTF